MQTPDYDTITIVWDKVQKAKTNIDDAYKVSAKYSDGSTELITTENCSITEEDNKIKCVITQPSGYDDASISGKTINFEVTTIGEKDHTTSNSQVYNLGPANLNVTRDPDLYADHINISWNRIEGANGYLVFRTIKDISGKYISDGNALFVKQDGVYYDGSKISSAESQFTGEKVSFTDRYEYTNRDDAQTDALKRDQIQLTWGLPFSYTVVPVLSDKDISFEISDSQIKAKTTKKDHTFTYENMSETISSTIGYGLNVNASKAASNTTVTVTWDQPYNLANKIPKVYRRGNKGDDWELAEILPQSNEKTMSVDITYGPNDTDTYEYAVGYYDNKFDETYLEKLASDFDTENSPKELKCKGYTLSLPQGFITARHGTGYQEIFDWTGSTYDFNNRNVGPDYYEIQILNKNKATGWTTIGKIKIDKDNNYDSRKADKDSTDALQNSTQVKFVSSDAYQAIFEPEFNSDNITTGQMQVLRDYKHYYRLVAVKMTDDKRENAIEAVADIHINTDGTEVPAYAIREITGQEFIKIGLLQYSYAINEITKGGWWTDASKNTTETDHGTWKIIKDWGKIYYRIDNYNNNQKLPYINDKTNTNEVSKLPVLLTTTSGSYNKDSCVGRLYTTDVERGYTNSIYPITISLTVQNEKDFIDKTLRNSYEGTFTFYTPKEAGTSDPSLKLKNGKDYLYVSSTKLSNPIECTNAKQRRKWLPLCMEGETIWYYNAIWENIKEKDETSDTKFYWWDTSSQGGN